MDEALVELIWERAGHACEYCRMPQAFYPALYEIDHIIARHHDGLTIPSNLALSCIHCNSHKGSNIAGRDKVSRKLTPLFNPRRHSWSRHFRWDGPYLRGRTAIGRVTVAVLKMNGPFLVRLREELIAEGRFPLSGR
jgi:hypothetical protein